MKTQTTDERTDLKRIAGSAQLFKEQGNSLTQAEVSNLSIWIAKLEHDFERIAIMEKRRKREQLPAQARRHEEEINRRMAKVRRIESYLVPITSTPVGRFNHPRRRSQQRLRHRCSQELMKHLMKSPESGKMIRRTNAFVRPTNCHE